MDVEKYRDLCNRKTIYSDKDGFFEEYLENMTEVVGEDWIDKEFSFLRSDQERIVNCYTNKALSEELQNICNNVQEVFREKSESIAFQRLQEAKKFEQSGNLITAMVLINQGLVRANKGSNVYIQILVMRINLSLRRKQYKDALVDTHLCLKEKIDSDEKLVLYRKMLECYVGLNDWNRVKLTMNVLIQLTTDDEERNKLQQRISQMPTEKGKKTKTTTNLIDVEDRHHETEKCAKVSDSLEVYKSTLAGRYMIAKEEIKTGETLLVEEPYASCLLPDKSGTNCQHCLKRLPLTPVPCDQCSSVVFCSIICQKAALSTYHRYECKFMDLLIGSGISVLSLMALRIITKNSLEYFKDFDQPKHPFQKIYSLEGHENRRSGKDYFHRTLTSLFLLFVLKKSGYFSQTENTSNKDSPGLTDSDILVARILLKSLQVLQFNAHEVYETVFKTKHHFPSAKINYVGVGIYPTVALFNHDCYPAVTRYFNGPNIIIKSLRPLKANEMVAENYGMVYNRKKMIDRQKILSARYWFQCQCQACIEDWPLTEALDAYPVKIRCSNQKCKKTIVTLKNLKTSTKQIENKKCPSCRTVSNITELKQKISNLDEMFYRSIEQMNTSCFREAIESLKTYSNEMHELIEPPYKLVTLSHEALRNCWSLSGNNWIMPEKIDTKS
uniref:Protein-lysine N-methyltransferase SMYD4 n=1 Tax=Cacopsylla melanoneura TaxID=428564 RepID=A0A8D8WSG7_9HEMI